MSDLLEYSMDQGRWVRHGRNIVVFIDGAARLGASELREVSVGNPSRKDLIDSRIDFHAQEALHRMLHDSDPDARTDAAGMFEAVQDGRLAGIYIENQF